MRFRTLFERDTRFNRARARCDLARGRIMLADRFLYGARDCSALRADGEDSPLVRRAKPRAVTWCAPDRMCRRSAEIVLELRGVRGDTVGAPTAHIQTGGESEGSMSDHAGCHDDHCCCEPSRRSFLAGVGVGAGAAAAGVLLSPLTLGAAESDEATAGRTKKPARIRAAFLYPPSKKFADKPDGWWSWPGNDFDAEARQKKYTAELGKIGKTLGATISVDEAPIATDADAARLAKEVQTAPPDGLLLMMFYNRSVKHAEALIKAAAAKNVPVIFYVGLGVMHGAIDRWRRPGVYFIQSLENFAAIEYGLRMIHARKRMQQSLLLSIIEAPKRREGVEKFLGTTVRVIPFAEYASAFKKVTIDDDARKWIAGLTRGATKNRGVTDKALDSAARAYLALRKLLADEQADGLTMNCLRRGMLKPCMGFSALNGQLIPAACENDFGAMYSQMIGQQLTGRPGFQHNPAFETEKNHYYASHCTCATKMNGPGGADLPYLLRRFGHTNEGSCAIQVFWKGGDPVTMMRYYAGKTPTLDVYAGKVVVSHAMPPAGGCTTNVEIALTDRVDARSVRGHHNLLFRGDYARKFRLFANLYKMQLAQTGYTGRSTV